MGVLPASEAGGATLAGSGLQPLRTAAVKAGAARDHFLGFRGVNGRGEIFKAGGKVVKNVTGYDLCKLMAGAYGTLAALEEVTVKVVPQPEACCTVLLGGLDPAAAVGRPEPGALAFRMRFPAQPTSRRPRPRR